MTGAGTIIAFVGLGALLSFAQTNKHMSAGPASAVMGLLTIPAAIALLWKISEDLGWWTIAAFVGVSLFVGTLNAIYIRKHGAASLFSMQPILGVMFIGAAVGAWFV